MPEIRKGERIWEVCLLAPVGWEALLDVEEGGPRPVVHRCGTQGNASKRILGSSMVHGSLALHLSLALVLPPMGRELRASET